MLKKCLLFSALVCLIACDQANNSKHADTSPQEKQVAYAIVIHGGAGTIRRADMTPEKDAAYRKAIQTSLDAGSKILAEGGAAIDAVIAAITLMENDSLFNAGKGAVFTHEGINELDASIMHGAQLEAGAVGGVTNIKHPIKAARAVMENSPHVMMVGKGAETFAAEQGLEIVDPAYFKTERRFNALQRIKNKMETELDHDDKKHGTVGAVALDKNGNIVAGTSTGGMTNKRYNRIGDSPVIGAGTYANNNTCGVSATGHGEYFIRYAVAHAVSAAMEYGNKSLEEAGDLIIHKQLVDAGGTGGIVALDKYGNISMPFNTEGMYRGYKTDLDSKVFIYKDEK